MEIEMKYSIGDKETAKRIWDDEYLLGIEEKDSREKVFMKASYFDTDDYILSKNDIAFRIRMEGNRIVASLKWNGESVDGLHTREEINVPVNDEACFIMPDSEIFKESDIGQYMIELVKGKPLHSLLETRFLRSKLRVDTGKSICEVAIDEGDIITDFGTLPICEMEIELFSGEKEDVRNIGAVLAEKYGLAAEDRSKYARGLKLLEENKYIG
ncbi:inorganic triphosphatase [Sinanaerobacter chloroacetimidivorans]|uniref:CYTH domain-containing protein n=1 Tax=Sinanaerobacter chloroacetimidivorans TaxID=2818044 RepID=A0A8J8B019_9FIRM|nr:CYTH domain-containing protein [Sinanaerobacter chloroacetimidivorans]MBR0597128.1 CYTH domain-containing protein [Sinanaerobacter chloroacetimidivorans]